MKKLLLFLALIMSFGLLAHANEATDMGIIVCEQNLVYSPDVSQGNHTVVLQQVGKFDYTLTFSRKIPHAERKTILQSTVRVFQEDVMAQFRNIQDRVHFMIYLDELDQSTLNAPGYKDFHFTCKFLNQLK